MVYVNYETNSDEKLSYENGMNKEMFMKTGVYKISPPIIKPSKLACKEKGGVGKNLSEGWGLNFSIGCSHGCIFCYADQIHRRRLGKQISRIPWGKYLYIPKNFLEVLQKTPWEKWKGKEVLMSATHDPYQKDLSGYARKILKIALPKGVKFCIQTRSLRVLNDMDLLLKFKEQIRVQISIATIHREFSKIIEPYVAPPHLRLNVLKSFNNENINTGVIVAPIFPSNKYRPHVNEDLELIFTHLSKIHPNLIFGETLHLRGRNMKQIEEKLDKKFSSDELNNFDKNTGKIFLNLMDEYGLHGEWWPEHRK